MFSILPSALVWAAAQTPAAPAAGGADAGNTTMLYAIGIIMIMFYFILWRPQRREQHKRESLLNNIAKGDKVMMSSGIYGTIESVEKESVTVTVAPKVSIEFNRAAVAQIMKKKE